MPEFDVVIRGGTIVDGTRAPRYAGDIGVKNGQIARIDRTGRLSSSDAKKTLDAHGLIVAPGFVDLHTYYDAQINWDPYCMLSGWHGVTLVVVGNCGFGFATVNPDIGDLAIMTSSRVDASPID